MKILFCSWNSLCEPGLINAIKRKGIEIITPDIACTNNDYDVDYLNSIVSLIQQNPDCSYVISVNFIPIVSRATKPFGIPYISITVDCPCLTLYSKTLSYPHNRAFVLDAIQAEKYSAINPGNVFHTPLATDVDKWDTIIPTEEDRSAYTCDVSFIGSLYSEKVMYDRISSKLSSYTRGYIDALINAQQNVFGYNFIEDVITTQWAEEFRKATDLSTVPEDYNYDIKSIVSDLYLNYKCTEEERTNTLREVSNHFNTDIYTLSDTSRLPNINNKGPADSNTMMPKIFKCSKINLNISLRSIKSGIPLRVFDVLGCGGFLISNYQPELAEFFTPGEDIVLYESIPDLLNKIDYYLSHEDERLLIAKNGYETVKKYYTYDNLLDRIFQSLV